MDLTTTDSMERVISHIDYTMQYGEDEEPKEVCCYIKATLKFLMEQSLRIWTTEILRLSGGNYWVVLSFDLL
jgi:hypothetical protein